MTGGIEPRSVRSSAVRTLMELTMAIAVTVEPGPTGVSSPWMVMSASAELEGNKPDDVLARILETVEVPR